MPGRRDIKRILVLGSGPIKIGQACEFDYSGTQACKALEEEGYEVILVNSNPATIMTDPEFSSRTYIEPLTVEYVERIISKEGPQALLPTVGGQTALNLAVELTNAGVLQKYGVELIGATIESITIAEDRERFRSKMQEIGMPVPRSVIVREREDVDRLQAQIPMPAIVRSAFTLGGTGSSTVSSFDDLRSACDAGLRASPVGEVLVEESVVGWKEIELEVVRDRNDNFIVVCGIENFDPMGVHTGDSITIAPIQTLSDREFQQLRNAAKAIISAVGVACGGANIQFAINPLTGEFVVIEMNPRVSRSSALASKATGYPIAKVAAKLAVGFTLDEVQNDIIGSSACFEPTLDYVVTKIPRFHFDKFYGSEQKLGTEMRSVGEVMAIGVTFKESFQKALRGLELDLSGFCEVSARANSQNSELLLERLCTPSRHRATDIFSAFSTGLLPEEVHELSGIDLWFLQNLFELWQDSKDLMLRFTQAVKAKPLERNEKDSILSVLSPAYLIELKRAGFGDRQIADLANKAVGIFVISENEIYAHRMSLDIVASYQSIDTCAAEFPTDRRYLYSTHCARSGSRPEVGRTTDKRVVILGGGPNRIGQGIEFDYCCVRASLTLRQQGVKTIMVNCNPETVSTDYDVSDTLFFEPLSLENVSDLLQFERPDGIIVQFGGQTPLKLAQSLEARGFQILGTAPSSIAMAEDRGQFREILNQLKIRQPKSLMVTPSPDQLEIACELGFPVIVRPNFVLGGRAMYIARSREALLQIFQLARESGNVEPVLIDRFLDGAIEIDVDAVSDGTHTVIAGIMEHVEAAGVHSGDSSCVIPPQRLSAKQIAEIEDWTQKIASRLEVKGLLNVQFAIKDDALYVLEVNPRASRTVPFVSKATGVPWVSVAVRVILGESLMDIEEVKRGKFVDVAVKSPLIPFNRFPGGFVCLGPEMRSTGEVMGIGKDFASAYAKAQIALNNPLPSTGEVMLHAEPHLFSQAFQIAHAFKQARWNISSSPSLYPYLQSRGIHGALVEVSPSIDVLVSALHSLNISRVVTLSDLDSLEEIQSWLRRAAVRAGIALSMTYEDALSTVQAVAAIQQGEEQIISCLQDLPQRDLIFFQQLNKDQVALAEAKSHSGV